MFVVAAAACGSPRGRIRSSNAYDLGVETGSSGPIGGGLAMRQACPGDVGSAQAAYRRIVEHLARTVDYPHWHSENHPPPELVRHWVLAGELHLAEADGEVAGVVVLNHEAADGYTGAAWGVDATPAQVLVVHALGVVPDFQRRGVARAMVEAAIRLARAAGDRAVRLDTYVENLPARRLYESLGFTDLGVHTIHYDGAVVDQFHLFEYVL